MEAMAKLHQQPSLAWMDTAKSTNENGGRSRVEQLQNALQGVAPQSADDELEADTIEEDAVVYHIPNLQDPLTDLSWRDSITASEKGMEVAAWIELIEVKSDRSNRQILGQGRLCISPYRHQTILVGDKRAKFKVLMNLPTLAIRDVRDFKPTLPPKLIKRKSKRQLTADVRDHSAVVVAFGDHPMLVHHLVIVTMDNSQHLTLLTALKALNLASKRARFGDVSAHQHKGTYLEMQQFVNKQGFLPWKVYQRAVGLQHLSKKERQQHVEHFGSLGVSMHPSKGVHWETMTFSAFQAICNDSRHRPDLRKIFAEVAEVDIDAVDEAKLTLDQLVAFGRDVQHMTEAQLKGASRWIAIHEPDREAADLSEMTFDGFVNWLTSKDTDAFNPIERHVHQDMREPLSHYFISSSHNTYITGHQLFGTSSVEMYRHCLLNGQRCLEIDMWDGSNGQPIVTHGHTLVSRIPLEEVLEVISACAFVASPYPVILSLEDHCSIPQQELAAEMFVRIFGDALLHKPLEKEGRTWDRVNPNLPSPQALKHRILLKHKKRPAAKKLTPSDSSTSDRAASVSSSRVMDRHDSMESVFSAESVVIEDEDDVETDSHALSGQLDHKQLLELFGSMRGRGKAEVALKHEKAVSGKKISQAISDLIVYTEAVKFKSFGHARKHYTCNQMSSFSERRANIIVKRHGADWIQHHVHRLSRIYPHGTRIDSTNFNPVPYWLCGAQMVALNVHTPGLEMALANAMFARNGGCGYVLKPHIMRLMRTGFNPGRTERLKKVDPWNLKLTIVSGQHLLPSHGHVSISVEMHGMPFNARAFPSFSAKGPNAQMNQTFEFKHIILPEMCFLSFVVESKRHKTRLLRVLPLACLQRGYRHVVLHTENDVVHPLARLFVKFDVFEMPVAVEEPAKATPTPPPADTPSTAPVAEPTEEVTVPANEAADPALVAEWGEESIRGFE
eukprot:m.173432 g.173432  ORF g.173432 m.173432 type:complete len:955 (+) comp16735_c0_seq2:119-2983(+)